MCGQKWNCWRQILFDESASQAARQPQTCILSSATRTKNHEKLFFLGGSTRQAVHRLTGVLQGQLSHWDSCLPGHTIFQQISIVQVSGIPSFILFLKSPLSILTWLNWAQLELSLAQLSPSLFTLLKILWKYLSNLSFLYDTKCFQLELVWHIGFTVSTIFVINTVMTMLGHISECPP